MEDSDNLSDVANQPKTPTRSIRISDDDWRALMAVAAQHGTNASEIVRTLVEDYLLQAGALPADGDDPRPSTTTRG